MRKKIFSLIAVLSVLSLGCKVEVSEDADAEPQGQEPTEEVSEDTAVEAPVAAPVAE